VALRCWEAHIWIRLGALISTVPLLSPNSQKKYSLLLVPTITLFQDCTYTSRHFTNILISPHCIPVNLHTVLWAIWSPKSRRVSMAQLTKRQYEYAPRGYVAGYKAVPKRRPHPERSARQRGVGENARHPQCPEGSVLRHRKTSNRVHEPTTA